MIVRYPTIPGNRSQVFEHVQNTTRCRARTPMAATSCNVARFTPDGPRSPEIHPSQVVVRRLKAGVTWALQITPHLPPSSLLSSSLLSPCYLPSDFNLPLSYLSPAPPGPLCTLSLRCVTISENHTPEVANSLKTQVFSQPLDVQDMFQPMPGLISCAVVTRSVGITHHDQLCWGDQECGYYMS